MGTIATIASSVAGVVLVLVTLREMFHELFHPGGSGSVTAVMRRGLWRAFRWVGRRRRGALLIAGPAMLVASVALWTLCLVLGWALLLWPLLPDGFRFGTPLVAASHDGLLDALYLSFVTLTTLGYGDITPTATLPRILAPLEAAVGFALLTAGISWILSVYPVLARRRALGQRLAALHRVQRDGPGILDLEPDTAHRLLDDLATALAQAHADLVQSTISYYFVEADDALSLAVWLPYAASLARDGAAPDRPPATRHAARLLDDAVRGYAAVLRGSYLSAAPETTAGTLDAYAADHLRRPWRAEPA